MLIRVNLDPTEREALRRLAVAERRREEAQAAVIIRRELERRGLLPADSPAAQPLEGITVDCAAINAALATILSEAARIAHEKANSSD